MKKLKIQTYIETYGLDKTILDFSLKSKMYSNKILLKYDQLAGNALMALPEVQECRGIVLELGTWKVLNMAFTKFFNVGETNAHTIDWNTAFVTEKLDGCCDKDTILITEIGEMTIREICETKYIGKVLSFDVENNQFEYDKIINHSIKKNINNWFEIELENGLVIKLTSNHKVWLPKLNCYRMVSDLTEYDEIMIITK
jgi:hypothetical protein